jgi:hypothetical protein
VTWWTADWQLRLMASAEQHHLGDELGRIWTPTERADRSFVEGVTGARNAAEWALLQGLMAAAIGSAGAFSLVEVYTHGRGPQLRGGLPRPGAPVPLIWPKRRIGPFTVDCSVSWGRRDLLVEVDGYEPDENVIDIDSACAPVDRERRIAAMLGGSRFVSLLEWNVWADPVGYGLRLLEACRTGDHSRLNAVEIDAAGEVTWP